MATKSQIRPNFDYNLALNNSTQICKATLMTVPKDPLAVVLYRFSDEKRFHPLLLRVKMKSSAQVKSK
jgi:hypothetical protein